MVEEQVGLRSNQPRELPLWTKLFGGFKVALDPKKLLLAAAGILVMSAGWFVLSVAFYALSGNKPEWSDYKGNLANYSGDTEQEKLDNAWRAFKQARHSWNLTYAMAAPVPSDFSNSARQGVIYFDEFDAWDTYEQFDKIQDELHRLDKSVEIAGAANPKLVVKGKDGPDVFIKLPDGDPGVKLDTLSKSGKLTAKDIVVTPGKDGKLSVAGVEVTLVNPADLDKIQKYLAGAKTMDQVRKEARERDDQVTLKALDFMAYSTFYLRPAGQFRTWPWFEYRGPNPYMLVTGSLKQAGAEGTGRGSPWEGIGFFRWLAGDEMPVLLEPLVKFLRPVVYLLSPAAGGWNRAYLILIILWTLATWAVFGGAITRMAAVQVARANEKTGMTEALRFAWARVQAYFFAPVLPLVCLAILTIFLWLYGLVGTWTYILGDVVVYGLFAPILLLIGLIMAVVLVGLVGWPLMYSTISAEGSDSFDAISRSYSYVYQAPWNYLWYGVVALAYGAVLVFFVGLMGSLMVYLGKWGISQAPGPQNRAPTYLFVYAPTSFGWRDLLLHNSHGVESVPVAHNNGTQGLAFAPTSNYWKEMSWNNYLAAFLVSIWLYLLFLMVVGFGYSYFWSASTIIYLLMRRKVDDTELDEIHLEEEDLEEPYSAPAAAAPAGGKATPAEAPVTMVESPTLRPPNPAGANPGGAASSETAAKPTAAGTAVANPPPPGTGPAASPPPGGNQEHSGPAPGEGEKK